MMFSAMPVLAATATAFAVLLLVRPGGGRARLARVLPRRGAEPPHPMVLEGGVEAGAVAGLAETVAAVARAGLAPSRTWALVAGRPGPFAAVARGAALWSQGGVAAGTSLLRAVPAPPPPDLVALGVALDVCERGGAPTAEVLEGLARALRAQEAARQDREAALAAPRATAAVLRVLPAGGLVLAFLLGADPVGVLLGTSAGRACLVVGGVLWWAGRWWTARLTAAAAAGRSS